MKAGTIIAIVVGVAGLATGGYVFYKRRQANAVLTQAQQNGTVAVAQQTISPNEGKAYRTPDGKIYQVRNGQLRWLVNGTVMNRELGTTDWALVKKSGVGFDVNTLPIELPIGAELKGFNQRLLR
jgi:LPXTG-motif cell wall-anchored protein